MELRDYHPWRMANLSVMAFVIWAVPIALIPAQDVWFGFITDRAVNLILSIGAGVAISTLTKRYVKAIEGYEPTTPIQAKRANEQIKLTATFSNAVSTAVMAVLVISQLVRSEPPNYFRILTGVVIALMVHVGGRNIVALIKPEKQEDTQPFARD